LILTLKIGKLNLTQLAYFVCKNTIGMEWIRKWI